MSRHTGGDRVKAGFYLNVESWEVTTLSGRGGVLEGGPAARFLRVPTLLLLIFAPLMGALYAIFLPFIGIAMVVQHVSKKSLAGARSALHSVLGAVSPAWQPGEAYFTGSPEQDKTKKAPGTEQAHVEERLKKIESEIERREKE